MKERLYLLPGTMCNKHLWYKMKPLLINFELIYLDIPLGNSFDQIINILKAQIKEEKINLLGFSLGGYIALYFACKFPEFIKNLIIISSSGTKLSEAEIRKRSIALHQVKKYGFKEISSKTIYSMFSQNHKDKNDFEVIKSMYYECGINNFLNQIEVTTTREDLFASIENTNLSILFIYSKNDILLNNKWIKELKLKNRKIKTIEINSSSHMLPLELPNLLSKAISTII